MNSLYIASGILALTLLLFCLDLVAWLKAVLSEPKIKQVNAANWLLKRYLHFKEQGDIHSIVEWQSEVKHYLKQEYEQTSVPSETETTSHKVVSFPTKQKPS